mgnify:CR=1 FL=1
MLKRLLFPSRPAFLLPKTAWKAIRDPGVKGMDIRVRERCGEVYLPCQGDFYALFLHLIRQERAFFVENDPIFGDDRFVSYKHK